MKAYLIIDSKEKFEGIPQDTNQSVEKYGIPLNSLYKRLERGAASGMELVPITKAQYESKHGKPVDFEKPTHRQRIMNRQVKASNDEPMSIGEKVGRATDLLGAGLGSGSIVAGAAGLGKQYEGVRPESVIGYAPIVGGAIAGLLPELYAVSAATGPLGVAKAAQGIGNAATNTMRAMSLRAASPTMARALAQHGRIASGITRSIPSGINYGLHRSARDAVAAYQEGKPVLPAAAQGALVGGAGGLLGGGVEGLIKYGNPSVLRNIAGEAVGGVAWNAAEDVVGRAIGQTPMTGVDYAVELAADIAMGIAGGKGDIAPLFKGSNLDQIRKNIRVVKDGGDSYIEVYGKRVPQPLTNKDAIAAREKIYQKIATASQTGTDVRTMFFGKDNPVMMATKTEQGAPSSTGVYPILNPMRRNTEDVPASIAAVDEQAPVEENAPSNNRLKLKKKSQTIVSEQEPVVEETAPIVPVAEQGKTEELTKENLVVDRGEAVTTPRGSAAIFDEAKMLLDQIEDVNKKPVVDKEEIAVLREKWRNVFGKTKRLLDQIELKMANPVANQRNISILRGKAEGLLEEIRMARNRLDEAEATRTRPVANQIANEQTAAPNPVEQLFEENERLQKQYQAALRSGDEEKIASVIRDIENTFGQKRNFTSLLKETKEILDRARVDDVTVRTVQASPLATNQAVNDYPELNKGTARLLAGYEHGPKTITAYAGADASDMAHEVTHHIVNNTTFSASEEAALSSRYPDYKKNKVNQERLARDAAEWWKNKSGYTNVDKVLRRVYRKIINAVKRWVHKHSKGLTEEDVFYAMFGGEVGKRRAGTDSRMGSFSSAKEPHGPVPKELSDQLDKEKTIRAYRTMELVDGKLYPPMSGKGRNPESLGVWMRSEESPDRIIKSGKDKGKFRLNKISSGSVAAAYAPYFHVSDSPLNDQFSAAHRSNHVTVEVEIPASELEGKYTAEGSKKAVGEHVWTGTPTTKKLGEKRKVILSRYAKNIRIVPEKEVAKMIADKVKPKGIALKDRTLTPKLRKELEALGVEIEKTGAVKERSANEDAGSFSSAKNAEDTPFFMRTMKIANAKGMPNVADSIIPYFKKLGVDDKELGALGIKEWLSENKKLIDGKWRVRLEDLRDHIAENAIDIKFFKYGGSENDIRPGETDIRRGKALWDEPLYTIPGHDGAIEFVASIPKIKDKRLDIKGTSHAYHESNVLGWLRGAWHRIDGAYVFLIDEIQSDVASKTRKGEMEPNELSELFGDRWYRILVKKAIDYAVRRGASRVAITTSLTHKQRYNAGRTSVKRNIKKKFYADDAKENIDDILNVFRDYVLRKGVYSDDKKRNQYANGEIWDSQFGEADGTMERAAEAFFSATFWYDTKALSLDGTVDKLRKDLELIAEDAFTVVSYDDVILDAQGKKMSTKLQSQTLGQLNLWSRLSPARFKDVVNAVKSNNYEGRELVTKLKPTGEGYENLYDKEAATWLNRYVKQWGVKLEDGEIKNHPVKMFEITPKVSDSVITEGQSTFSSAKNIEGEGEIDQQARDFIDKRIGEERKGGMLNRIATAGKNVPPISMSIKSYMEQIGSLPRKKYIAAGEAVEKHMASLDKTRHKIEDSDTVSGKKNPEGFDIVFSWRTAVQGRARRLVNDLLINRFAKDNDKADDARKKLLDLREKISYYPKTLLEDSESRFLKKVLGSIDKATKEETDVSELFPQEAVAATEKLDDAAKMFKSVAEESKLLPSKDADDISKLKQELSDLENSEEFESAVALKHAIKKRKKFDADIKKLEGLLSRYSELGEDAFIPRQDQEEIVGALSAFGYEDEGGLTRVSDLRKTILQLKEDLRNTTKLLMTGDQHRTKSLKNTKKIVGVNKRVSELRKKIEKLSAGSGESIDITPGKDLGVRTIDGESIRVGLPYIFRGAYASDDAVVTNPAAPNTMQTVVLGNDMEFKDNIVVPVTAIHTANDRRFVVVYTVDDGEINFHNIEINRGDKGKYQPIDDDDMDSINAEINKLQDKYEKAVSGGKTDLADTFANRIDDLVWQREDKKVAATNRYKGSGRSVDVADLVLASNDNMAFAPPSLKANANLEERILRDALSGDVEKENRKFMQYLGSNNINRSWLRMAKKITGFKFGSIDAARDAIDSARKNLPKKKQALLMDRERLVGLKKKSNNQGGIPASEIKPKIDEISLEIEDIDSRIRAIRILDTSIKNFGKTQDRSLYRLEELHNLPKEKRKKFEEEYQSLLSAFVQYKTQGEEPYTLGKSTVDSGSYSSARSTGENMERIRAESLASRTVMARAKAAANRVAKSFRMFQDLPSSPKFAAARELTVQIESMLNNVFKHANSSVDAWVSDINKNDIKLFSDWMILRDAQYTEENKGVVFEEFKDWKSKLEKVESEIDKRGLREKFNETTKTRQQEFLRLAKLQQKEGVITDAQLKEIEKNLSYFHRQIVGFQRSRSGRKRFVNPKIELPSIQREIENMRTRLDEDAPGLEERAIEKRRNAIEKKEKLAETLAGYDDVIYIDKKLKNVNIIESDIDAFNQMYRSIAVGRFKRLLFGKYDESMSMDSVIRNLRKVDDIRTSSGAYLTKEKLMGLKYEDAIAPGGVFSHVKDPEQLDLLKQYLHFEDVVKFSDFPKDSIMWKTIEDSPALVKIFNNIFGTSYIDKHIAEHLAAMNFSSNRYENMTALRRAVKKTSNAMRVSILLNPVRFPMYKTRNIYGDFARTITSRVTSNKGTSAKDLLVQAKRSFSDVRRWIYDNNSVTGELRDEMQFLADSGLLTGGLTASTIDPIVQSRKLKTLLLAIEGGKTGIIENVLLSGKDAFSKLQTFNEFSEAVLRVASYRIRKKQLDVWNREGRKAFDWGASNKGETIDIFNSLGIDHAAKYMANNDIGAYSHVSQFTKEMNDIFMFLRYTTTSMTTAYRSSRNAIQYARELAAEANKQGDGGKALAKMLMGAVMATTPAWATAMAYAWNNALFGEQEEQLPDYLKYSPHLNLGGGPNGYITFGNAGDMTDVWSKLGLKELMNNYDDLAKGRITAGKYFGEALKGGLMEWVNMLGVDIKLASEITTGMTTFPQVQPITKTQSIMGAFGLGGLLKIADRESPVRVMSGLHIKSKKQNAMTATWHNIDKWRVANDKEREGIFPKDLSYQGMKRAAESNNIAMFKKNKAKYDKSFKDFVKRLDFLNPKRSIAQKDHRSLYKFLDEKEREDMRIADAYAKELKTKMIQMWKQSERGR